MNDRENDNRIKDEGRQVQQELEDQLRAFGDTMTDAFAPLVPALLPYGVKKALTSASTAAGWSAAEKAAALRTLGADLSAYYTRNEADARFGAPYTPVSYTHLTLPTNSLV